MDDNVILSQKELWENQHVTRKDESARLALLPNEFALFCVNFLSENSIVLELGIANGRDSRFFIRSVGCKVIGIDFSMTALRQLKEEAKIDGIADYILPVMADIRALPLNCRDKLDLVYARSSLHVCDDELYTLMDDCIKMLKKGGYICIEGKTIEDLKIARSRVISPNLYLDSDNHLRRCWSKDDFLSLATYFHLNVEHISTHDEIWQRNITKFIRCVLQK